MSRSSPDIVERLRVWPAGYGEDTLSSTVVGRLLKNAADEIEHLRASQPATPTGGEAVAWELVERDGTFALTKDPDIARIWRDAGDNVRPLYAAPTAMAQSAERCSAGSDEEIRTATLWFEQQIENAKQDQITGFAAGPQVRGEKAWARHCALYEAQQVFLKAVSTTTPAQPSQLPATIPDDCQAGGK